MTFVMLLVMIITQRMFCFIWFGFLLFCFYKGQYHYVCIYCSKAFLTSYALKLHYRSHTQERPFYCNFPDCYKAFNTIYRYTHTHTHTTVLQSCWILCGTTRVSWHQKGKTSLDLVEQEIVNGSGISWAICKSAPWPRHVTTPASHQSVFYSPDALPATQPTASKHWRHLLFTCTC